MNDAWADFLIVLLFLIFFRSVMTYPDRPSRRSNESKRFDGDHRHYPAQGTIKPNPPPPPPARQGIGQ